VSFQIRSHSDINVLRRRNDLQNVDVMDDHPPTPVSWENSSN
jgi:hypothetical protein